MAKEYFFEKPNKNSIVKANIVSEYFNAWAKIMSSQPNVKEINYIDLYSGMGAYENGAKSTPLLIIENAILEPKIRDKIYCVFNDENKENINALKEAIKNTNGINTLKYYPKFNNETIDTDTGEQIEKIKLHPTFSFIDPYGFKGLTRTLIKSLLKDWGCDIVFFFNYNRMNMGITNPLISDHVESIFGKKKTEILQKKVSSLKPVYREKFVLKALRKSLEEQDAKFVIFFRFYHKERSVTSHYLVFVTKKDLGFKVMKETMSKHRSSINFVLNCYEFNIHTSDQKPLFDLEAMELENKILKSYTNKKISAEEIFSDFSITLFTEKEVRAALLKLEASEKIMTNRKKQTKPRKTFPKKLIIEFP